MSRLRIHAEKWMAETCGSEDHAGHLPIFQQQSFLHSRSLDWEGPRNRKGSEGVVHDYNVVPSIHAPCQQGLRLRTSRTHKEALRRIQISGSNNPSEESACFTLSRQTVAFEVDKSNECSELTEQVSTCALTIRLQEGFT